MAYVFQTTFGAQLAARLQPWMNDDLALFCDAVGSMFSEVADLVYDQGVDDDPGYAPGYSALFDVDACPVNALGFLAQIVGTQIPAGTTEAKARALIRAHANMNRGTVESIQLAVLPTLNAGAVQADVRVVERVGGDPYAITVITRPSQTPSTSASTAAALSQKPGGLVLTYVVSDGPPIDTATLVIDSVAATVTIDNVQTGQV